LINNFVPIISSQAGFFRLYPKSGDILVSLVELSSSVIVSDQDLNILYKFYEFLITEVLEIRDQLITIDSELKDDPLIVPIENGKLLQFYMHILYRI
jgi:hypothetical protein